MSDAPTFLMAHLIVTIAELYAIIGAIVATWFLLLQLDRIDPAARGAYAFRPLLIPGLMLLWPLVLLRCAGFFSVSPRHHRRTHYRAWLVLSVFLPVLLFGAIALRQNGPTEAAPVRIAPP
jgi:hypothetical protein